MKKQYNNAAQKKHELQELLENSQAQSQQLIEKLKHENEKEIEKLKKEKEREIENLEHENIRLSSTDNKVQLAKSRNKLFKRSEIVFNTALVFQIIGISLIFLTLILTILDVFDEDSVSPSSIPERIVALVAGVATSGFGSAISRMQNQYNKQFTTLSEKLENLAKEEHNNEMILQLLEMLNKQDITELQQQEILKQIHHLRSNNDEENNSTSNNNL